MQLFELVSPRLFRPLAGPNRAFYAELLLLLWEECRHTADYSISRAEAVSRAEDYFAALAKPLALDADDAGDEAEQPTRDPIPLHWAFCSACAAPAGWKSSPAAMRKMPALAFVPEVAPLLEALEEILNPRVVTYTGKLYKAWQLLQNIGEEKSPYEKCSAGGGLRSGSTEQVPAGAERIHRALYRPAHPQPHPAGGAGAFRPVRGKGGGRRLPPLQDQR